MQKLGVWSSENIYRILPKSKSSVTENCQCIHQSHLSEAPNSKSIQYHTLPLCPGKIPCFDMFFMYYLCCIPAWMEAHRWERECHTLPSSTSLFSAAVLLGMNRSNIKVAKQNQVGRMKVNLMACKLGFSTWQTESKLISLCQQQ